MSFLSSLFPAIGGALGFAVGGPAGALVGSGIGGAITSNQAAQQQVNAGNQALDLQRQIYGDTRANLQPYMQEGNLAIPQINAMLGLGPQGMQGAQSALAATPGYQFARNQGLDAILNKRSALGGVLGGNTLKELDTFGTGLADQTYQSSINNLLRLLGGGQNAAAGLGGFGAGFANQAGNLMTDIGSVQSAGILGGANAVQGGINNWLLASLLQQGGANPSLFGGGASGAGLGGFTGTSTIGGF